MKPTLSPSQRRLAVGLAVAAMALAFPAGAAEDPGAGLSSYSLRANAPGLGLGGLFPNADLTVPEANSSLTTGGVGAGLAALAWPGPIAGNLGDTLLVLQPAAPDQVRSTNDPVRAETRTGGTRQASNTTLPGTVMTSSAEPSRVSAHSRIGSTTLPIGTVGALTGDSAVTVTGPTGAAAEASSSVQDLSLADGMITIASAVSHAAATSDGLRAAASGSTLVTGITVAGIAVRLDGNGLHVAGQSAGNPVPQQTLNDAVSALGLTMLLTTPRTMGSAGSVRYDTGALVVLFTQGGRQLAVTVGRASVAIDAARALGAGPADQQVTPVVPRMPAPPSVSAGGLLPPATDLAPLTPTALGAPAVASLPTAPEIAAPPGRPAALEPAAYALPAGLAWGWTLVGLLFASLAALGLRRLPDRLLTVPTTTPCVQRNP